MSILRGVPFVIPHGMKQLLHLFVIIKDILHMVLYRSLYHITIIPFSGVIPAKNGFANTLIPTHIDSINCIGDEASIFQCHIQFGGDNSVCDPSADAGIICQSTLNHIRIMLVCYMQVMFSLMAVQLVNCDWLAQHLHQLKEGWKFV